MIPRLRRAVPMGFLVTAWVFAGAEVASDPGFSVGQVAASLLAGAAILAVLLLRYRTDVEGRVRRASLGWLAGTGGILLLVAAYALNPCYVWGSGGEALPVSHVRFLPASTFASGTWRSLRFAGMALGVLGMAGLLSLHGVSRLTLLATLAAAVTALVVLDQRIVPRPFPVYEATGFFAYENHYAAFANLVLPVTVLLGERQRTHDFRSGKASSPAGLYVLAALLSVVAVAISGSRAGLVIAGLLLGGSMAQVLRVRRRYPFLCAPASRVAKGVGLPVAIFGVGVLGFRLLRGWRSLGELGEQLAFRGRILADALRVWWARPLWGTGPGSFERVFPFYQSMPSDQYAFSHAHCEPIEFLVEYGVLGACVVLAGVVIVLRSAPRVEPSELRVPKFAELEAAGFALALAGVALHSLVDFPLRHPLNALMGFTWAGILASRWRPGRRPGLAPRK